MTTHRRLGRSEIKVSALGVGCWAMGGRDWGGGADDTESIRAIHRALELGVNLFDTAEGYGDDGRSERVLGDALAGRRDQAVIATKFWGDTPDYVRQACDASLRRLRTDHIDLYQFHLGGYGPDCAEAIRAALEELVVAGKIGWYGWSTDSPDRARIFAEGEHCAAVQCNMSVLRDAAEMLSVCQTYDLAAINRGPLAMGLLSGKYDRDSARLPEDDIRRASPEWMRYFKDGLPVQEWLDKLQAVVDILRSNGRTPAQGALAWLLARSERNLPIPGFRSLAQVEENCRALEFGPLTPAQMAEIETLLT